ncbi:hypothetical protein CANARDRAFT_5769 [[Candida] arabinofermentans NRRL YB-2248]|uniref:Thiaminase-2/PQQC domain-containing protein n=1 Tax=[Candida] arabinofermentans NRRL YB-2248 TaxID=983967 RepID=A0A1E4T640_9ASCO|nr:hypothetical protein CANARDRAFT_5769 [[Candida] arabinofermentans NRRL YB-2248]
MYAKSERSKLLAYLLNDPEISSLWELYTGHPILKKLADGSLPFSQFNYLLQQNYCYLKDYAELHSLMRDELLQAPLKPPHFEKLVVYENAAIELTETVIDYYSEQLGGIYIKQGKACNAYIGHLSQVLYNKSNNWLVQISAFLPCIYGYYDGCSSVLSNTLMTIPNNSIYREWLTGCLSSECLQACNDTVPLIDEYYPLEKLDQPTLTLIAGIFKVSCECEIAYWDEVIAFQE